LLIGLSAQTDPLNWLRAVYTQWIFIGLWIIGMVFLPESPWHLARQKKVEQAKKSMKRIYGHVAGYDVRARRVHQRGDAGPQDRRDLPGSQLGEPQQSSSGVTVPRADSNSVEPLLPPSPLFCSSSVACLFSSPISHVSQKTGDRVVTSSS
jgi:hypothetical protein